MKSNESLLVGILIGAGLMYLMDPDRGRRRRALVRDQLVSAGHDLQDTASAQARHARNQAMGAAAEVRARATEGPVDDTVLEQRVRAEMGRHVSNPSAIQVSARDGEVTLRGPVLADDVQGLVRHVRSTRGVSHVDNQLDVHQNAADVPSLQGGRNS